MKNKLVIPDFHRLLLVFILSGFTLISTARNTSKVVPLIQDKLNSTPAYTLHLEGFLGKKIDLCINERIKKQDVDHLIEPFRHREETRRWQSEFWGK